MECMECKVVFTTQAYIVMPLLDNSKMCLDCWYADGEVAYLNFQESPSN